MLSVAVPCFDEAAGIARLQAELPPALEALDIPFEILCVDDGSRDDTRAKLESWAAARSDIRVLAHDANRGLGAALKTALAAARGEWLLFLDADLTFDPRLIADMLRARDAHDADCVSGSPQLGGMPEVPLRRKLPSLLLNAFYRGLIDYRLTAFTPMFRLYRTADLRALDLRSDGFEISVEILAGLRKARRKIVEIPAPLTARRSGVSKLDAVRELARHLRLIRRLLTGR